MVNKKDIILFYTKAKLEEDAYENYMGFFWWILDPVMSALVYYVVFHLILHSGRKDYIQFLFVGIVAWKWFSAGVKSGSTAISNQKALYKKVFLPKIIFSWIEINFLTVKFLFAMLFIAAFYPFIGFPITINHIYLPSLIFSQFVFTLGIGTFFAALSPFFPDFNMMITHLLRLAFYPSGIIFSVERVPMKFRFIMTYNPMARAIEGYRNIIMYGERPSSMGMIMLIVLGVLFYVTGALIIKKFEGRYAKLL
jgi:ABC-type polysaccharide/polyol phosphate export permease